MDFNTCVRGNPEAAAAAATADVDVDEIENNDVASDDHIDDKVDNAVSCFVCC